MKVFVLNLESHLTKKNERGSRKMIKINKIIRNNYRFGSGKCGTFITAE